MNEIINLKSSTSSQLAFTSPQPPPPLPITTTPAPPSTIHKSRQINDKPKLKRQQNLNYLNPNQIPYGFASKRELSRSHEVTN